MLKSPFTNCSDANLLRLLEAVEVRLPVKAPKKLFPCKAVLMVFTIPYSFNLAFTLEKKQQLN
jgi:hypothetical protein